MTEPLRGWMIRTSLCAAVFSLLLPQLARAQSEADLKTFFEGKRVTVKLDMPRTSDGIDAHVAATPAIDLQDYVQDLNRYGAAIGAGESVTVTLVKTKRDLVEFQLNGGGFGTFGDDTSTTVYIPLVEKSHREKELEEKIDGEQNPRRRRELERDLDELRERRERENRRIMAERERASEIKRAHVAEQRLRGGSRFNLRYASSVPAGLGPGDLMAVLAEYVDFSGRPVDAPPVAVPVTAQTLVAPRKGLSRLEAERLYGRPIQISERRDGTLLVKTLVFTPPEQRIVADFVDDVLVRYSINSR